MTTETPDLTTQLPKPVGYKILCAFPEIERTYANGILKADSTVNVEQITSMVLFVISMGPEAYKDLSKFPSARCKEGDFVICRAYAGTRMMVHGKPYVLIDDDAVEATVEDPRGIKRA